MLFTNTVTARSGVPVASTMGQRNSLLRTVLFRGFASPPNAPHWQHRAQNAALRLIARSHRRKSVPVSQQSLSRFEPAQRPARRTRAWPVADYRLVLGQVALLLFALFCLRCRLRLS